MAPRPQLLLDAGALFDVIVSDASVLLLVSTHVGPTYVSSLVFDTVTKIERAESMAHGLRIVEPDIGTLQEAGVQRGSLCFQERLVLLIARDRGFTCVSNDKCFRKTCEHAGVSVRSTLDLVAALVSSNSISAQRAREIVRQKLDANKSIDPSEHVRFLAQINRKT